MYRRGIGKFCIQEKHYDKEKHMFRNLCLFGGTTIVMFLMLGGMHPDSRIAFSAPQKPSPFEIARTEAEAVGRFAETLRAFDSQAQAMKAKGRVTASESAALESKANAVRGGISGYQQNLNGFISKLKGAGKWTSEFDAHFENIATKSGFSAELISEVKSAGGARAFLEKASNQATALPAEIEQDLKTVKAQQSSSWFNLGVREARAAILTKCRVYYTEVVVCGAICCCPPCTICTGTATCKPL
jgi:hypothetical protein